MASHRKPQRIERKPNLVDKIVPFYDIAKETFKDVITFNDEQYEIIEPEPTVSDLSDCFTRETKKSRFCEIKCDPLTIPTLNSVHDFVSEMGDKGTSSFLVEVSAYDPEEQQVWLDADFVPVGYGPAWRRIDGEREDIIFMFKGNLPKTDVYFAKVDEWNYHRNPGTWFVEPIRSIVEAIYDFK